MGLGLGWVLNGGGANGVALHITVTESNWLHTLPSSSPSLCQERTRYRDMDAMQSFVAELGGGNRFFPVRRTQASGARLVGMSCWALACLKGLIPVLAEEARNKLQR